MSSTASHTGVCGGPLTRREMLRGGGLGMFGLSLPHLLALKTQAANAHETGGFGRAKSCILLYLSGGPPQHEKVIGSSDREGGFPASRALRPPDLAATVFHLLGINPAGDFPDLLGRPRPLTNNGVVIRELAGA